MTNKVAFFDFDGTLIAPLFYQGSKLRVGFPPSEWMKYCWDAEDDAYNDCVPIDPVIEYARKLKRQGYELRILSVTYTNEEQQAKKKCIYDHSLHVLFEDRIHFVDKDADKIQFINSFCRSNDINPRDCIVIEDTMSIMFDCLSCGYQAIHVSHIITGCYDPAQEFEDEKEKETKMKTVSLRDWIQFNCVDHSILKAVYVVVVVRTPDTDDCSGEILVRTNPIRPQQAADMFGDYWVARLDSENGDFVFTVIKE